jgi:hypothetical protein
MITKNQAGLNIIPLDTPEVGWVDPLNANWETLRRMNAVGGLAIRAHDVDPVTLAPTSLHYDVAAGIIRYLAGIASVGPYADRIAPASTSIYIWLDMSGNIYQGAGSRRIMQRSHLLKITGTRPGSFRARSPCFACW